MNRRNISFGQRRNVVSEQLAAVLLATPATGFHELFEAVQIRLHALKATRTGEEMLRLRVYEKLQTWVGQGLVKKTGKKYAAVRSALSAHSAGMPGPSTAVPLRRSPTLHVE